MRTIKKTTQAAQAKSTVRFDAELHKRLRILAIEWGTSFEELVNQAVREYLRHHGKEKNA